MQSSECARAAGWGVVSNLLFLRQPETGEHDLPYPPLRLAGDGSPLSSDEVPCLGPGAQDDPTPPRPRE